MKQLSANDVDVASTLEVVAHLWMSEGLHRQDEQVDMKVSPQ